MKRQITKSKIIATLGPSSIRPDILRSVTRSGVDCFRINFSHGSHKNLREMFETVRNAYPEVSILCDIQGPKLRIGRISGNSLSLLAGDEIKVLRRDVLGTKDGFSTNYEKLILEMQVGERLFINDGTICLEVMSKSQEFIDCKVLVGGVLASHKGINLPNTRISTTVPTPKDKEDLRLIASLDPEYVAVSFVEADDDIQSVRTILRKEGNRKIKLIAKIERPAAVEQFSNLLRVADGVMIARGDLGVELPPEDVLPAQKKIIKLCNTIGKPAIVATQMLESMVQSPIATRAEVSDVYNAIEDGADAVMLSAETAIGKYPVESVRMMERVIKSSEAMIPDRDPNSFDSEDQSISEIIGHLVHSAAIEILESGRPPGKILCLTQSGYTARMIAKYRPPFPIIAVTPNSRTARELQLIWGVQPLFTESLQSQHEVLKKIQLSVRLGVESEFLNYDEIVLIAGNLLNLPSKTNMVDIIKVSDLLSFSNESETSSN